MQVSIMVVTLTGYIISNPLYIPIHLMNYYQVNGVQQSTTMGLILIQSIHFFLLVT